MREMEVSPGTHIDGACQQLVDEVRRTKLATYMVFNGIRVQAFLHTTPEQVRADWDAQMLKDQEEYRASDAYKEEQARRANEVALRQAQIDALMGALPEFLSSMDRAIDWVHDFTPLADDIDVRFDKNKLADAFEAASYKRNAYVGTEPHKFTKQMMGEWIIGQVIECLRRGMPPHPVGTKFCEDYQKMQ